MRRQRHQREGRGRLGERLKRDFPPGGLLLWQIGQGIFKRFQPQPDDNPPAAARREHAHGACEALRHQEPAAVEAEEQREDIDRRGKTDALRVQTDGYMNFCSTPVCGIDNLLANCMHGISRRGSLTARGARRLGSDENTFLKTRIFILVFNI